MAEDARLVQSPPAVLSVHVVRPALLLLAIGAALASLQAQVTPAHRFAGDDVSAFVDELARRVREDNRPGVAALLQYPVTVRISGLRLPFPTAEALLARYDEIFTPALRAEMGRAAGPSREGLSRSDGGAIIGNHAVTIALVGGRLRVTGIAVPPPENVNAGRTGGQPRRIAVRAGPRPTRLAGSLAPGGIDTYVVFVPRGQWLQVRLERVRREATVRVVHAKTGLPLNGAARGDTVVASGRVTDGADYRVEVRRVSTDASALPYLIAVTLK